MICSFSATVRRLEQNVARRFQARPLVAGVRRSVPKSGLDSHRRLLRAATQDLHDETERAWSTSGGFGSREHYLSFLKAIRGVHVAIGFPAAELIGTRKEIAEENARIRALSEDLGEAPHWTSPDQPLSRSFAWGVGYGLNGSTLGASVMLKAGHCRAEWPSAYFRLGRDYVQSGRLARFFQSLDAADLELEKAVAGARAVFERLASAPAERAD